MLHSESRFIKSLSQVLYYYVSIFVSLGILLEHVHEERRAIYCSKSPVRGAEHRGGESVASHIEPEGLLLGSVS
jgi:hypothetical protein